MSTQGGAREKGRPEGGLHLKAKDELVRELLYEGFWEGKIPCWEMVRCPPQVRSICPAPRYPQLPCWEIEGTYAKLTEVDGVMTGTDVSVCRVCRVYQRWGGGAPIQVRLFGKGIDSCPESLEALRKLRERRVET